MISVFSVLPPESIKLETLEILLKEYADWEESIERLIYNGWLDKNEEDQRIKISPVIQEIVKNKNEHLEKDVFFLLDALGYEMAYEPESHHMHGLNTNFSETMTYATYSESLLSNFSLNTPEKLSLSKG